MQASLTDLLKKGKAENIQWSEAQERAYSVLKEYLLQEPGYEDSRFELAESGVGVVAVLHQ